LADPGTLHRRKIDEALITTYWDDPLRLATSVRLGTAPASLMLRRLGSYPRQNGLALAMREVGRIERTLFTLDWAGRSGAASASDRRVEQGRIP
jgi:TnpA family transposase